MMKKEENLDDVRRKIRNLQQQQRRLDPEVQKQDKIRWKKWYAKNKKKDIENSKRWNKENRERKNKNNSAYAKRKRDRDKLNKK